MTQKKYKAFLCTSTALVCCLLLGACSAARVEHPRPGTPEIGIWESLLKADQLGIRTANVTQPRDIRWWHVLNDPLLNDLIDQSLRSSHLLAAADARMQEAAADAGFSRADLMPQVDGNASVTRLRDGNGPGGLDTQTMFGVRGTWDLDLFGVNKHRRMGALQALDAARADRDRIRIDLIADVATAYIRLRGAQAQLDYAHASLKSQARTLEIIRGQREEGIIGDFDVTRTQAQTETTRARLPQLETAVATAVNRINVLCGVLPGALDADLAKVRPVPDIPSETVISMPIALLSQRPDIQTAMYRLHEAASLTTAESLEIYPDLSVSAFFGFQDSHRGGSLSPWNMAASALMPLLDFGRVQARVESASAREMQAYHTYEQTVLAGVAEAEDALTAYMNERRRTGILRSAAKNQARAADIVREQFRAGEVDQTSLLLAEKDELDAGLAYAASKAQRAENLVRLYRALGWGADARTQDVRHMQNTALDLTPQGGRMKPIVDE